MGYAYRYKYKYIIACIFSPFFASFLLHCKLYNPMELTIANQLTTLKELDGRKWIDARLLLGTRIF